ncbi:MAG TPA: hypothetical protein VMB72_03080 [Acidimicrobiales bacterium]|nr:hypothetical protein [Acidimicrobiales bacterium]
MTPSLRLIERYRRGEIEPEELSEGLTALSWSPEQVAALLRNLARTQRQVSASRSS